ncbi:MAG: hypothetical protein HYV09_07810 [Deltaproteobacteria bacterium]|nr:hypothetical protein [Deltaproteobacteria bacterium]
MGRLAQLVTAAALGGVAVVAIATSRAEVVDPTVATAFAIGDGGARWPADRGGGKRTGAVASLPMAPKPRWTASLGARVEWPPVVDARGTIVVAIGPSGGTEGGVAELDGTTGKVLSTTRLRSPTAQTDPILEGLSNVQADSAAGPLAILANGTRVVVTIRGYAVGLSPGGAVVFRTRLGGDYSSVPRVGVSPLPGGGFAIARRPEVIELDAHGNLVDRVRLEVGPYLAVRESGEVLGVSPAGELIGWRAGRLPRSYGSFGDKGTNVEGPCRGGVVLDGSATPSPGGRKERAICVTDGLVEQLDLVSGARKALLGKAIGGLPYRTGSGIGESGDLAVVIAGGALVGAVASGGDLGPWEVPGAAPMLPGKDGGVTYVGALGEVAPLVADDGAVAWATSDGVALLRAGTVSRVTRCGGSFSGAVAGLASAAPGTLVVACSDGKVQLLAD